MKGDMIVPALDAIFKTQPLFWSRKWGISNLMRRYGPLKLTAMSFKKVWGSWAWNCGYRVMFS